MKRLALILILITSLIIPASIITGQAAAVNVLPVCGNGGNAAGTDVCKDVNTGEGGTNPVIQIMRVAISILAYVVGVAAVIGLLVSGLRLITANGDSSSVASARS